MPYDAENCGSQPNQLVELGFCQNATIFPPSANLYPEKVYQIYSCNSDFKRISDLCVHFSDTSQFKRMSDSSAYRSLSSVRPSASGKRICGIRYCNHR